MKIILIDGNSLAYRAFYALPDTMKTTSGIVTNAIYGFTTMLIKILEEKPDYVAISFDLPEPTFRHKAYKAYKGTRDKAPPTLYEQLPYVKEIARAFEIPIYEQAGFQADDVIGTLAIEAEKAGHDVVIMTGDLDPLQLVNEKIKVLANRKGLTDTVLYGEKEVIERYGLKPEQLIDYKALKGDSSDNIPGVPKVGEITAVQLLQEFGTLDNILSNTDKITKKALKANLENNHELAYLSKKLGTIVTNVPIEIDFEQCKRNEINWAKVLTLLEKFEFERLVKKCSRGVETYTPEAVVERKRENLSKFNFQCVQTDKEVRDLILKLENSPSFAFDLETTGLDVHAVEIVGISFSTEAKSAFYLPLKGKRDEKERVSVLKKLKPLFVSDKLKIGHNIKYDIEVLKTAGVPVNGPYFDTMVAAYILDPISNKYSLKKTAKQFLGREMIKLVELIGEEAEHENFADVPLDVATDYACSDAEATFALYDIFKIALKGQKLDKLFYEIEMPLLDSIIEMEYSGITIDTKLLAKMSKEMEIELKDLERHIFAIAGETFNLNSPKQLGNILFNKLQLPIIKKTKTGASTDSEVLETLAAQKFEIAEKLSSYRGLTKLKSTYVDVLPTLINPKTGRIHTSFNQPITATGRLSSSKPNMQNIPLQLRAAFVPEHKEWEMLAADYSQVELRVLAHLSEDPQLIKAFKEDKDIHTATAAEVYGVAEDTVTKEMRNAAKAVNFGIIYGISDFGLAKQLKIKRSEAAEFITKYFNKHQGVKTFIDKIIKEARENNSVATLLGRKRPLPDINSPNHGLKSFAERTAVNTVIQGTAADLIKIAMVNIKRQCVKFKVESVMLLQVHDELVFECPKSEVEKLKKLVQTEMENALELIIPLKVDMNVGQNWAEAK